VYLSEATAGDTSAPTASTPEGRFAGVVTLAHSSLSDLDDFRRPCVRIATNGGLHLTWAAETPVASGSSVTRAEIYTAFRPSGGAWTTTGPISAADASRGDAAFPSIGVPDPPTAPGGLVTAWRYKDRTETWYATSEDAGTWTTFSSETRLQVTTSAGIPVRGIKDPCVWFGPDGHLLIGTHGGGAEFNAWVSEAAWSAGAGGAPGHFGWLQHAGFDAADRVLNRFVHGTTGGTTSLATWSARSTDVWGVPGLYGALGVDGPSLTGLDWSTIDQDMADMFSRWTLKLELPAQVAYDAAAATYTLHVGPIPPYDPEDALVITGDLTHGNPTGWEGRYTIVGDSGPYLLLDRVTTHGSTPADPSSLAPADVKVQLYEARFVAFSSSLIDSSDCVHLLWFESRVAGGGLSDSEPVYLCYRRGCVATCTPDRTRSPIEFDRPAVDTSPTW